jgi:hypothetical protein
MSITYPFLKKNLEQYDIVKPFLQTPLKQNKEMKWNFNHPKKKNKFITSLTLRVLIGWLNLNYPIIKRILKDCVLQE